MDNECIKSDIKRRLNRIEGQVRGIERMVDSNECCTNILVQVAAVRSAINKVGGLILDNYTKSCIKNIQPGNDEELDELIDTIIKFTRYYETK